MSTASLLVFTTLLLLQLIFIVLRLNQNIEWLWSLVLIPFWVLTAFVLVSFLNILYSSSNHEFSLMILTINLKSRAYRIYWTLVFLAWLAFVLMVDLELDLAFTTWLLVFIPFWIFLGIYLLFIFYEYYTFKPAAAREYKLLHKIYISRMTIVCILLTVFSILLPLKLQGSPSLSWDGVFIPLWILFGIIVLNLLIDCLLKNIASVWYNKSYIKSWHMIALQLIFALGVLLFSVLLRRDIEHEVDPLVVFSPLLLAVCVMWVISFYLHGLCRVHYQKHTDLVPSSFKDITFEEVHQTWDSNDIFLYSHSVPPSMLRTDLIGGVKS